MTRTDLEPEFARAMETTLNDDDIDDTEVEEQMGRVIAAYQTRALCRIADEMRRNR